MKRTLALVSILLLLAGAALGAESLASLKATYETAIAKAKASPADYAANWAAAQAARKYGDELVGLEAAGWKETARAVAKEGMRYGEIAQKLNPKGVEGYYWYAVCVGTYSDCVSILTALSEGLKGKTQKGFETAYELGKGYDNYGPILGLGRFWQVLPGIAGKDLKKAEALFNEYIALFGTNKDASKDAWYYRGALYKEIGKIPEARVDLQKASAMGSKEAAALLAELK